MLHVEREGALVQGGTATKTPLEEQELTAPVQQQPSRAVAPSEAPHRRRGMEAYEPRGIVMPPRLRIGQPMTSGITEGMFLNENTGEEIKEIRVVFLTQRPSRVLFDDDGNWLCRSNDGHFPSATTDGEIAPNCAVCPYSKWGEDGTPPKCKEYWNFLAIDTQTKKPLMLQVHGVSMRPADAFMQNVMLWDVDLFRVAVTVSLELQEKKNRRYYQLRFTDLNMMDEEEAADYEALYTELVERGGLMSAMTTAPTSSKDIPVDEEVPF